MSLGSEQARNAGVLWVLAAIAVALSAVPVTAQEINPFGRQREPAANAARMSRAEFVDAPLSDVLRVVSDLTGWTIITSPGVSASPPSINLWVHNMRPADVLQQVVDLSGLVLHREDSAYHVMTFEEFAAIRGVDRRVVALKHITAANAAAVVTPFAGEEGPARIVPSASGNRLVLLAPAPLLEQLVRLVDAIDVPQETDEVRVVRLQHLSASEIGPLLDDFLAAGTGASGEESERLSSSASAGGDAAGPLLIRLFVEPSLNTVVVRGRASDVDRTEALLRELDQAPDRSVVSYQLRSINAANARGAIEQLLAEYEAGSGTSGAEGRARSSQRVRFGVSEANNRVVVEAPPSDQERIAAIIDAIDRPLPAGRGGIRVYRLENATADEVAGVLEAMLTVDPGRVGVTTAEPGADGAGAPIPETGTAAPGVEAQSTSPRVMPAPEINAVVVRASAEEHASIAEVIQEIDQPRDQVLIEATLVTVSSSDDFTLGVEIGGRIGIDATDVIGFTSFGVGAVDSLTGLVTPGSPASFGANVAVINNDDFSLVLNALKTVGDVRVTSRPKILVQDNSSAELQQLNEVPFEITSQGDTSTLTSFGGFVDAGTTLTVTPYISRDNWLRLDYEVNLSSFLPPTPEQVAANLPPARVVNTSTGNVRVPSGHMVVLGGLRSTMTSETRTSIPILGDIPLLGALFRTDETEASTDTLFIFVRPVALRDREFADLRALSLADMEASGVADDGAPSNPLKLFGRPVRWYEPRREEDG
ncbi:MAG: secretin N-terminal domain-containing protein [Planctomycetota bacterium]